MKLSLYFSLLILASITVFSCKKEERKEVSLKIDSLAQTKATVEEIFDINEDCTPLKSAEQYINVLMKLDASTKAKIANNSNEDNNKLYLDYKKKRNLVSRCLMNVHVKLLEEFYNYYDEKAGKIVLPANIKKVENDLNKVDLQFSDIGEGIVEIADVPTHYLTFFKGKVTKDYEDYISQLAIEDENGYAADAGIVIPWKEVGDRLIFWENYLKKYPKTDLREDATANYQQYLSDYLLGMDNTLTYEDGKMYPEVDAEFFRFIKKYPNSSATPKIIKLQELVTQGKTRDEIHEIMNLNSSR